MQIYKKKLIINPFLLKFYNKGKKSPKKSISSAPQSPPSKISINPHPIYHCLFWCKSLRLEYHP